MFHPDDLLLITGATGLVGSHVAQRAAELNLKSRALVRSAADEPTLAPFGVESVRGELTDPSSLQPAVEGVTLVVHCAAKVGDWGPVDEYRAVNVRGLEHLLNAVELAGTI